MGLAPPSSHRSKTQSLKWFWKADMCSRLCSCQGQNLYLFEKLLLVLLYFVILTTHFIWKMSSHLRWDWFFCGTQQMDHFCPKACHRTLSFHTVPPRHRHTPSQGVVVSDYTCQHKHIISESCHVSNMNGNFHSKSWQWSPILSSFRKFVCWKWKNDTIMHVWQLQCWKALLTQGQCSNCVQSHWRL